MANKINHEQETPKKRKGKGKSKKGKGFTGANRGFKDSKAKDQTGKDTKMDSNYTSVSNDPSWWIPKPLTAQQMASYPWNTMAGFDIATAIKGAAGNITTSEAPNIAGVMRFNIQSTLPRSVGSESPLNRASLGLFADILTKNSSNVPFEHTDLMMSMIALADIDAVIAKGMRAYGLIHKYPVQNRYLARCLVEACGFDYDDLIKDPYAFVARLNVIISRRNRFYIPKNFNWRSREVWLSKCIYKDSDDPKSQFYVFNKDSYFIWSPRTSSKGSELTAGCFTTENDVMTTNKYFSILESMLEPLENDQDIYIMQGYLLKRYELSEFVVMPTLSPDFVMEPVIDYSVLTMIQNARVYTSVELLDTDAYDNLSQSDGQFVYDPSFFTNVFNTGNLLLTSPFNNPTPEDTIEATRLIIPVSNTEAVAASNGGLEATINPAGLNADVISSVWIYSLRSNGVYDTYKYNGSEWGIKNSATGLTPEGMYLVTQLSYFDFHPIVPVINVTSADGGEFIGFVGDFDNTMILTQNNLKELTDITSYGIVNIVDIIK